MSFFHLRSLPGSVWPPIPKPQVSLIWSAYQALDRTQWLKPGEIEQRQLTQLRGLVAHAYEHIPYYRRVMDEADVGKRPIETLDDFRRIPLLTRPLCHKHAAELKAAKLPPGIVAEATPTYTSGTTGVPLAVWKTNRDGLWWHALFLRDLEWCNIDPCGTLVSIRSFAKADQLERALRGITQPVWHRVIGALIESGPIHGMDIRQDPRVQLEWLLSIQPDYLLTFPSNLELLGGMLQQSGKKLARLRAIQAVAEPLPEGLRQRAEAMFGVPIRNTYSSTEAGYVASPCPQGHGLHVHSESILAEVLDADNNPCAPGQTGRLVFTTLHNFLSPFIRLDIGDDVTLAPGSCPCGRGLPLWSHVDGRQHPYLHLPSGARKSSTAFTLRILQVKGIHQFQLIQRAVDHVIVRAVPDSSWSEAAAQEVREIVIDEMQAPVRVDVEVKQFLERPEGGKLKRVIVEVKE